jgi:tight adherence protein B
VVNVAGSVSGRPFAAAGSIAVTASPSALPTEAAAPPPVAAATPVAVATGAPRWWLLAGIAAVFLGLLALVAGAMTPVFMTTRQQLIETIEAYTARVPRVSVNREQATSAITTTLVDLGERIMSGRESTSKTMALLQRADLPWRAGEWAVLRVVSVVIGVAFGTLLLRGDLLVFGIVVGAILGLIAPAWALRFLANRRGRKFELQMPDILMLVASSLATGFSLPQALDAIARDVAQPAAKEFARVMAETRIGADVEDAMERMAVRMDSDNMRWTAMAIRIQRQVGGNLAETLRTTAATLREREFLRRHVRALSAEGRLSAYILTALPILIFLYEVNVNREYISLLWSTTIGWVMIIAALISMAIGIFWMSKTVKVEV